MNKLNKKILILIIIAVLAAAGIILALNGADEDKPAADNIESRLPFATGYGMEITNIGSYSGPYMEDASDEEVKDIMMIQVKNTGEEAIQYAEITLSGEGEEDAVFKFSTLKKGQTMTVLESTKKKYRENACYTQASSANVAYFQNKPRTYPKKLEIQPLDGGLNVTNISNKDIDGEIVIYFKDCDGDMLMGGITYRGRIEGGIKAGEICQLMSSNFTKDNTKVMFITIDGE